MIYESFNKCLKFLENFHADTKNKKITKNNGKKSNF